MSQKPGTQSDNSASSFSFLRASGPVISGMPIPSSQSFVLLWEPRFPAFQACAVHYACGMANPAQPEIKIHQAENYRESYANSVQVRVNVWDFFLVFGTLQQPSESQVEVRNFQGIYLSPQQAKALLNILHQNVTNYEAMFGEIKLDPRAMTQGPVH